MGAAAQSTMASQLMAHMHGAHGIYPGIPVWQNGRDPTWINSASGHRGSALASVPGLASWKDLSRALGCGLLRADGWIVEAE